MSDIRPVLTRAQYKGKSYSFPIELSERWNFLVTKLNYAELENHEELFGGYSVVFKCEFKQYED